MNNAQETMKNEQIKDRKTFRYPIFIVVGLMIYAGCTRDDATITDPVAYKAEIGQWRNERLTHLKARNGWLNLAGLYWLQEGLNTFGSDTSNTIVLPATAPSFIGILELNGDSVYLRQTFLPVMIDSLPAANIRIKDDASGEPDIMSLNNYSWHIIKRGNKYGIRLRDYESALVDQLDSLPYYETDIKWRIVADYKPFEVPEKQKVQTVIGTEVENLIPGELTFRVDGKKMSLFPIASAEGLSLVFGDRTNGDETYPAGRFMDISKPDENNKVIIDFNKAYNPPCAFTPYATCQLPHRGNILPVKIEAGEKAVHLSSVP